MGFPIWITYMALKLLMILIPSLKERVTCIDSDSFSWKRVSCIETIDVSDSFSWRKGFLYWNHWWLWFLLLKRGFPVLKPWMALIPPPEERVSCIETMDGSDSFSRKKDFLYWNHWYDTMHADYLSCWKVTLVSMIDLNIKCIS